MSGRRQVSHIKYTRTTDAALDRAYKSVDVILKDQGTTDTEKAEVLNALVSLIRNHYLAKFLLIPPEPTQ